MVGEAMGPMEERGILFDVAKLRPRPLQSPGGAVITKITRGKMSSPRFVAKEPQLVPASSFAPETLPGVMRRELTILIADIAGYARLTEAAEATTHSRLKS